MPTNRFVPALAAALLLPIWAWAQAPVQNQLTTNPSNAGGAAAKKADEPPTDAEKAVDAAVAKLKALKSASADLTQKVDMLREKFEISGQFLKAPGDRIYLKLVVVAPTDSASTMLQVCDGKTLWDFSQVLDSQSYRKLDVAKVRKKLADPILDDAFRDKVVTQIGFSGPEAMLKGFRESVKFNQKADGELNGRKVWIVRGQWKSIQGLLGANQQPLPPTAPLPAYIPSNIAVYIDQETGWPHKVEMIGNTPSLLQEDNRRIGADGKPIGQKITAPKVEPSRITFSYANVKLNEEIKPELFAFQAPPDAKGLIDGTDDLLNLLDQAIQVEAARKRAEAAKGDPLLGGIDIPKSSPTPLPPSGAPPTAPEPPK